MCPDGRPQKWKRSLISADRRRFGQRILLSVTAGMPEFVFVSGRSDSKDFPTPQNGFFRPPDTDVAGHFRDDVETARACTTIHYCLARRDDFIERIPPRNATNGYRLRPAPQSTIREATGVFASVAGDYLTGCTHGGRRPITAGPLQRLPKGNSEPFGLRLSFQFSGGIPPTGPRR